MTRKGVYAIELLTWWVRQAICKLSSQQCIRAAIQTFGLRFRYVGR